MNFPVEYVDTCAKDVDNVEGVSKTDYFPIPSRYIKPLEKKVCFVASP